MDFPGVVSVESASMNLSELSQRFLWDSGCFPSPADIPKLWDCPGIALL